MGSAVRDFSSKGFPYFFAQNKTPLKNCEI